MCLLLVSGVCMLSVQHSVIGLSVGTSFDNFTVWSTYFKLLIPFNRN